MATSLAAQGQGLERRCISLCSPMITAVKRALERRDILTLLLADPARLMISAVEVEDDDDDENRRNDYQMIRRLAAHLHGGNIRSFPANELKSILCALLEECRCSSGDDESRGSIVPAGRHQEPPPRKRVKRVTNNINLHSILRFAERIVHQRYEKNNRCDMDDDYMFLEVQLKGYFGVKDATFQIEEDILSLAFEIALHAITVHFADDGKVPGELVADVGNERQRGNNETMEALHTLRDTSDGKKHLLLEGVIKTALRIIDFVVVIDRCERNTRLRLQRQRQASMSGPISSKNSTAVTDRRKKYEHLFRSDHRRDYGNGGSQANHHLDSSAAEVKSVMEEKYPEQWEWLRRRKDSVYPPSSASNTSCASDSPSFFEKEKQASKYDNIVIIRRRIESLDDISLSSNDSDDEMNNSSAVNVALKQDQNVATPRSEEKITSATHKSKGTPEDVRVVSQLKELDHETNELRLTLLEMPPSESSSTEVIRHIVDKVNNIILRYGEVDGAAGISRCGDIMGGILVIDDDLVARNDQDDNNGTAASKRFPLNDAMVSSLVTVFLTDATGAIRAKAFLRSFVLPLVMDMNPATRSFAVGDHKNAKDEGKPASRVLTALLESLARDRPTECVISVVVPTLVSKRQTLSIATVSETSYYEPTRFQCELISRVLRGKDALSLSAVALLVEEAVLSTNEVELHGMKWNDSTMSVLTACLNRQPSLSDEVVAKLADRISRHLSPSSSAAASQSIMANSMKFSTLFHAFVSKYGSQLKATGKVEMLKESSNRLKTFMSKTIALCLKKIS